MGPARASKGVGPPARRPRPRAGLVEQVDEADVGGGDLGHQLCQPAHRAAEVEPRREGGDDAPQQLVLLLGLRGAKLGSAQWKSPSRSATATAWARSPTSSLR